MIEQNKKVFTWARTHPQGYECSSAGDYRFSALYAMIDEETIESRYQLDCKGFRAISDNWHDGKGKPPINGLSREQLWVAYKGLWQLWAAENPDLIQLLRRAAVHGVLTDRFAYTEISQARALSEILNET